MRPIIPSTQKEKISNVHLTTKIFVTKIIVIDMLNLNNLNKFVDYFGRAQVFMVMFRHESLQLMYFISNKMNLLNTRKKIEIGIQQRISKLKWQWVGYSVHQMDDEDLKVNDGYLQTRGRADFAILVLKISLNE